RLSVVSIPGVPCEAPISPEAAAPAANSGKPIHRLDTHHIFRHLVTELALDAEPERRTMRNWQRRTVHVVGEEGLRMKGVFQPDRFVIFAVIVAGLAKIVGAIEHDVARIRLDRGLVEKRL